MKTEVHTEIRRVYNLPLKELVEKLLIPWHDTASYTITIGMDNQERRVEIISLSSHVEKPALVP
jgi:hypothetical protein